MHALFILCRDPGNGFIAVMFLLLLLPAVAGFFLARWILVRNPFKISSRGLNILVAILFFLLTASLPFLILKVKMA